MGEHAEHMQAFVLIVLGQHPVMNALVGQRNGLRRVAEERKLGHIGQRETAGRVAMDNERKIGETIFDGIKRLRRGDHRLGQQIAFHPALGCLLDILAERHCDVRHQQMRRRNPGIHVQDRLRASLP